MRLASPEWLLLLPLLALAGWVWPRLELRRPLRLAGLLVFVFAMAGPELRTRTSGLDLWVLVDRSASAAEGLAPRLAEWEALLARSRGAGDRLFFVDYAETPVTRAEGTASYSGDRQQTRTALAATHALASMSSDRAARVLVLSDGYSTEPLGDLGERLRRQEVALDYRLVAPPDAPDFAITDLRVPARSLPGEAYLLELDVAGNRDAAVPFEVRRDGRILKRGEVDVRDGVGRLRLTDRSTQPGAHRYEVILSPAGDALTGNNRAERWIEVVAGPRVLLVTAYPDDPVARALRAQGIALELVDKPGELSVGRLAGARAVILANVPASDLPADFLAALDFHVREQGAGLLMTGGARSFGSGGYFKSAIDPLLPVSMELRSDIRKLAVAMAIALDRSGSMAASVSPGVQKMDLANEGTARAVELLSPRDAVAVFAVDSEAHPVVPLTGVGRDAAAIGDQVRRIGSAGGGIFVFNALKACWDALQQSDAGQRHVVLFADAADAEEPGDYRALLAEMVAGGVTVSVIGLGSESDPDAALLKEIAALGKGRIFFNADANTLPALFEQETVAIARSAFLEEPVAVKPTEGWLEIAARPLAWPAELDGYNLSYLRPEATAAALSGDSYAAPLVAFWQRGAGRVAAVTFPLAGDFSGRARRWPAYGDFVQTLGRWLIGVNVPPGLGLRSRLDGTEWRIELWFDPELEERFAKDPPRLTVAVGATGAAVSVPWRRLEPGRYEAAVSVPPGQWMRGAVQVAGATLPLGPVNAGVNPEWTKNGERRQELRAVAQRSGGGERVDLARIWQTPRRSAFVPLRDGLLVGFALLFLLEALATRVGWAGFRRG